MVRTLLIAVLGAATTFAGGFSLEFGNPAANPDAKAKGAALVVRAVGCHSPEKAVFTGTAEGVVNGKRQTIALTMIPLGQPGVFAVKQQWPSEGSWVLTFAGSVDGTYLAGATVPVSSNGVERFSAKNYHRKLTEEDIQASLR
jgi:hypothetical protein